MAMTERDELEALLAINEPLEPDEIRLNKEELIRLWELGILSDLAYFVLVLRAELTHDWKHLLEDVVEGSNFYPRKLELTGSHIDYLMFKWRGTTPKNNGDLKPFTADVILSSLAKLQKKKLAVPRSKQLTLFLGDDAPFTRSTKKPEPATAEA